MKEEINEDTEVVIIRDYLNQSTKHRQSRRCEGQLNKTIASATKFGNWREEQMARSSWVKKNKEPLHLQDLVNRSFSET